MKFNTNFFTVKQFFVAAFCLAAAASIPARAQSATLSEEFRKSIGADIVVIFNGDDFGKTQSSLNGVEKATEKGVLTSTSLIATGIFASQAIEYILAHPKMDVGVHLNIITEGLPNSPILPVTDVPTLVDEQGHFFTTWADHIKSMKTEELEKELDAQVRRLIDAGVDVTHLDSHTAYYHADDRAFKIVKNLALRYQLPVRYSNPGSVLELKRNGILCADTLTSLGRPMGGNFDEAKKNLLTWIRNLRPGIHEVVVHPATLGPDEEEAWRETDMNLMLDTDVRAALEARNVRLVGFRALREFQRSRKMKKLETKPGNQ